MVTPQAPGAFGRPCFHSPLGVLSQPCCLTHGLQLSQQLLPGPLQPLSTVAADGTKDGAAALSTILQGWDVQVVHKDDVRVLKAQGYTDTAPWDPEVQGLSFLVLTFFLGTIPTSPSSGILYP